MRYERYKDVESHWRKESGNANKILILTGLSGSGKDYLLESLKKSGNFNNNVSTYSFGEKLFQEVKKFFPELKHRDQLKSKLSNNDLVLGIERAIKQILKEQPVLLNTQVVYQQGDSLSTRPSFDERINAASYVYVWTDPVQIAQWRDTDLTRNRTHETVDEIAINQSIALVVTAKIAQLNQSSFHTIENRIGNARENSNLLNTYLEELGIK